MRLLYPPSLATLLLIWLELLPCHLEAYASLQFLCTNRAESFLRSFSGYGWISWCLQQTSPTAAWQSPRAKHSNLLIAFDNIPFQVAPMNNTLFDRYLAGGMHELSPTICWHVITFTINQYRQSVISGIVQSGGLNVALLLPDIWSTSLLPLLFDA